MEGIVETNHSGPLCISARDLDRVLHGFGAGINEHGFFWKIPRCERIQFLGNGDVAFIWCNTETDVEKLVDLLSQGGDDAWRSLPHIQTADTAGEINETISVYVFEYGAFPFRDEHRRRVIRPARHRCV